MSPILSSDSYPVPSFPLSKRNGRRKLRLDAEQSTGIPEYGSLFFLLAISTHTHTYSPPCNPIPPLHYPPRVMHRPFRSRRSPAHLARGFLPHHLPRSARSCFPYGGDIPAGRRRARWNCVLYRRVLYAPCLAAWWWCWFAGRDRGSGWWWWMSIRGSRGAWDRDP